MKGMKKGFLKTVLGFQERFWVMGVEFWVLSWGMMVFDVGCGSNWEFGRGLRVPFFDFE